MPDLTDLSWDRLDTLVDTDPIGLRDLAWVLVRDRERLRYELGVLRDMAYQGGGAPTDAVQGIHARACRALNEED